MNTTNTNNTASHGWRIKKEIDFVSIAALVISLGTTLSTAFFWFSSQFHDNKFEMLPFNAVTLTFDYQEDSYEIQPNAKLSGISFSVSIANNGDKDMFSTLTSISAQFDIAEVKNVRFSWDDEITKNTGRFGQETIEVKPKIVRSGEVFSGDFYFSNDTGFSYGIELIDFYKHFAQSESKNLIFTVHSEFLDGKTARNTCKLESEKFRKSLETVALDNYGAGLIPQGVYTLKCE